MINDALSLLANLST